MKLPKYITVFAASVALLCSSCNDMEQPPRNKYTDANFWSAERAEYMVNMAYSQMYSAGKMFSDIALSDDMVYTRGGDQYSIRTGTANAAAGLFSSEWSNLYGGIKTCHVFLENIDLLQDVDASVKARMVAEVRFIRAFLYFRLTNFYGAIPFFTSDISLDEANVIGRTPREEVITFVQQELNEIIDVLPSRNELSEADNGRITQAAVAMFMARTYLMDSDWANVVTWCEKIMNGTYGDYALFPSYAGLFTEANEYNEEVILDRSYVPQVLTWGEGQQDMYPIALDGRVMNLLPYQDLVDSYMTSTGCTINEQGTDYDPENPYENRDSRLTATIIYDGYKWNENIEPGLYPEYDDIDKISFSNPDAADYWENSNASSTGYCLRKWFSPQAVKDWNSGLNIIMMRYADVLLMYAEAKNEIGQMSESVWNQTIRAIRERAGLSTSKALSYPTSGDMRQIIRNERRVELAMEGLRWYDIKRWKAGSEYLNKDIYGASFTNWTAKYMFNEERDYLWAVPQSQLDLNPNLGQNEGW